MTPALLRALREDDGVALVEYGIITAAIALVAVASLQLMGITINGLFANLTGNWSAAAESGR